MEKVLPQATFIFTMDADIEVLEEVKDGPSTRLHTESFRKGDALDAYLVKETRQHYFVKVGDRGVAFLHKISVTMN